MQAFRLNGLLTLTYDLLRRHGLGIYVLFLSAGIFLTTAVAVFDPDGLRARMTGAARPAEGAGLIELVLLDPASYLSSVLYTCVMTIAFLRLWIAEHGEDEFLAPRGQTMRENLVMLIILQAIADMVFTLSLLTLLPLSAFVAAVTMGLLPAVKSRPA